MNLTMSALAKQEVLPFPFDKLPQVDLSRQQVLDRLTSLYAFAASQEALLDDLAKILGEMLQVPAEVVLAGVDALTAEELHKGLPADFLMLLLRVEPQAKKGFLLFDLALAQWLVEAALGGAEAAGTPLALTQIKPITPLAEAVVSYVTVVLMESLASQLQERNLGLCVDRILREPQEFANQAANRERFAVFVVTVSCGGHDFHLKLGLPLTLSENFFQAGVSDELYGERLKNFTDFKIHFDVEVGNVSLSQSEFLALNEGDIVLLDEVDMSRASGRWQGSGVLQPSGGNENGGYKIHFETQPEAIQVRITGVL